MEGILMKCGHTAMAKDECGNPYCIICNCSEIEESEISLEGREAQCSYCGNRVNSQNDLPFFKYQPNKIYDEYYCGCFGWD